MDYFALRVSTQERKDKDSEGKRTQQEFDRQKFVFTSKGYTLTNENTFADRISGGTNFEDRPNFSHLLEIIQPNDTIHFCEVTRFSRDYIDGMRLIDLLLFEKKVNIVFVSDNRTLYAGKKFNKDEWLFISMQLLWAEYRKREISEYTSQALRAKMQSPDFKIGKPKTITNEQEEQIKELYAQGKTMQEIADMCGISKASVCRILKGDK